MLCRQLGLYEEILAPSADAPIDTAQSTPTATDPAPMSLPPNDGERAKVRSVLNSGDGARRHTGGKQQRITEPQHATTMFAQSLSINREDTLPGAAAEWKLVRFDCIDLHPSLPALYQKQGILFPPMPPSRYLTPHGILRCAAHVPMRVVVEGSRLLCFAGARLYLAALNSLEPSVSVGAFVHATVTDDEMAEAIETDELILPLWFRETRSQRKAHELRHLAGADPRGLTYHDQDQQQLSELFKTCQRTVQYREASRRRTRKS